MFILTLLTSLVLASLGGYIGSATLGLDMIMNGICALSTFSFHHQRFQRCCGWSVQYFVKCFEAIIINDQRKNIDQDQPKHQIQSFNTTIVQVNQDQTELEPSQTSAHVHISSEH